MKTLVIIPAHNEEENIERVVNDILKNCPLYDYIVVNDGSTDHTAEICAANDFHILNLPINLGLSGAFQAGMLYAYQNNYDAAIQFDGDGQHDSKYISLMLEEIENGNDIVIGSRFHTEKKPHSLRMLGSNLISDAIQLTTGVRLTDPTSGMRMYNKNMIALFAKNINFGPEPDTISYLLRCGAKITEIQVEMHERIAGTSYLNVSRSIKYMLNMFISILFVQFFRTRKGIK